MAESTIVKTKRDGTIKFSDNAGANTYTVAYEAGDLNISIPGPSVISPLDRGSLGSPPSLRYSDDAPITGSLTAYLRDLGDAAFATLSEIITQTGHVASTWVSTMGADAEVFTLDLEWTIAGPGAEADHVLTLPFCVVTGSLSEGDPDQISISFTSYSVYPSSVT
tara:strand:- start:23 stop:517 length:495 start_codon:yes stop_codon:yes gene_type:complete